MNCFGPIQKDHTYTSTITKMNDILNSITIVHVYKNSVNCAQVTTNFHAMTVLYGRWNKISVSIIQIAIELVHLYFIPYHDYSTFVIYLIFISFNSA
jgi:hypothetical protein